jgi:flagellin-like hook-associated protein FlgL
MRVPYNAYVSTLTSQLGKLNFQQVNLQRQLSNGQRVTESFDDPAAVGRALSASTEKVRIQAQSRNLNRAALIAEFSSETLGQLKILVDKATIDANQTDGLTSSADFRARALQTNQQIEQALRVANAQISGDYLFAGANMGEPPFVANRYQAGDFLVDSQGRPIYELGDSIPAVAAANVTFINAAGDLVDAATGEATTEPPTAATTLGGVPNFAIEWTAPNAGTLKEWNGSDYSADALDGAAVPYGTVTVATNATSGDFVARASTIAIPDDFIGMVSYIEYTGTSSPNQDIRFRVGEGATIAPFSRGQVNLEYLDFFNDLIALRDAYSQERLTVRDPQNQFAASARSVKDLTQNFTDHQQTVLLGIVDFGSFLQGIDVTARINENRFNELERLSARELDIDVAQTIMKLNRAQIAYESALKSGASVMQLSLMDYL